MSAERRAQSTNRRGQSAERRAQIDSRDESAIFDLRFAIHYPVMEYLEGETVAARLTKGPLPIPLVEGLPNEGPGALPSSQNVDNAPGFCGETSEFCGKREVNHLFSTSR